VFEFSGMRCQPLRRALVSLSQKSSKFHAHCSLNMQLLVSKFHNLAFEFLLMLIWQKALKTQ
ncbi:hypothetical protein, partial [Klebsiella pneumoniae]|uniref:hypothetical protein n=1 Tax=Klebsiella pneumoniae TaxID=573 RepID=UPI001D0E16BB